MVMTHAQEVARIIAKHPDRAEMITAQSIVAMSPLGHDLPVCERRTRGRSTPQSCRSRCTAKTLCPAPKVDILRSTLELPH